MSADRSYHHGDLPTALLGAVDELIRDGGLEAVSLRAAARRAGVSHAAPAHHFGDKAGLLTAFAVDGFRRFAARMEAARDATDGAPTAKLRALFDAYLAFALDEGPSFEVMFRPELHREGDHDLEECGGAAFTVLVDQVRLALDDQADEQDVFGLAMACWAAVHGLATLVIDGPADHVAGEALHDLAEPVVATLLAGLRAHPRWAGDGAAPRRLIRRATR